MSIVSKLFGRSIPAYTWVGIFYVGLVLSVMVMPPATDMTASAPTATVVGEAATGAPAETITDVSGETAASASEERTSEAEGPTIAKQVEARLQSALFAVPLVSGDVLPITWSVIITVACLFAGWIEAIRVAQTATDRSAQYGNDIMSLIVTVIALVLFVTTPSFGTSAFLIIVVTGIGDLLLDRIIGQAVARRDFGGMLGGGGS